MKEYVQEKNHTATNNVTRGSSEKMIWMCMKEYIQEINHTDAHNVTKVRAKNDLDEHENK